MDPNALDALKANVSQLALRVSAQMAMGGGHTTAMLAVLGQLLSPPPWNSQPAALQGSAQLQALAQLLATNGVAQAAALALGRPGVGNDLHRDFPGNRPSTVYLLPRLDAISLGALLACHEHATFTAATVLGINPFDQFGVELGKVLATSVEQALAGQNDPDLDPATRALVQRLR